MTSTADKIIAVWSRLVGKPPTEERPGSWRGISPLRPSADNPTGFSLKVEAGGEHGAWFDFPADEGGSLYELARRLNIDLPTIAPVQSSRRRYAGLEDYAQAHGASVEAFTSAGWVETIYKGRPALNYPTANGMRWRFLDGNDPPYINADGYKICWYGLDRAIKLANESRQPLILCNGEASTVVAQSIGLPAAALASGEKRLPDAMLAELESKWSGDILLVYDCDETGRRVSRDIQAQIPRAKIIDLEMDNHGDLADFIRLWGQDAGTEIYRRARLIQSTSIMIGDMRDQYMDVIHGRTVMEGKPVILPFQSWHQFGGLCAAISPGKLVCIMGASGGGKTAMLETITDIWNQQGEGGLYYGPEWTAPEVFARRVQRWGGPSLTDIELHKLYMRDLMAGIPDEAITGLLLTPEAVKQADEVGRWIVTWPGRMEYFRPQRFLEDLIEHMSRSIEQRRTDGELVTFAIVDYAQVLRVQDVKTNDNQYEFALGQLEAFAIEQNLVCLVGSQVTKEAKGNMVSGQSIGSHQAQYLREDKFKLFCALKLQYEPDSAGNLVRTNRGTISIEKNNLGTTGEVRMIADFARLRWIDQSW